MDGFDGVEGGREPRGEMSSLVNMQLLEYIWDRQSKFNANFHPEKPTQGQLEAYTKDSVLAIQSELSELINNITWKPHRKERTQVITSNVREELIDIFKFWNGLCLAWGMSPKEFLEEWLRKTEVVEQRFLQEFQNPWDPKKYIGCVVVDIDGVIADYYGGLMRFIKEKTGVEVGLYDGSSDLYSHIAQFIGAERAYEIKHQFRETGEKLRLDPIPGAQLFLKELHSIGVYILLLTARPYRKYKRIMSDTLRWLKLHDMPFHSILWDEDKAKRVVEEYPFANAVIEDDPSNSRALMGKGFKVFIRNTCYNQLNRKIDEIRFDDYSEMKVWLDPKFILALQ